MYKSCPVKKLMKPQPYFEEGTYWLTNSQMTVFATINEKQVITDTSSITKRFLGQSIFGLRYFMRAFKEFKMVKSLKQ